MGRAPRRRRLVVAERELLRHRRDVWLAPEAAAHVSLPRERRVDGPRRRRAPVREDEPRVGHRGAPAVADLACVEIKILRRVRAESSRRPPRRRRDACSMAWRCRFLAARRARTAASSPRNDLVKNFRVHPAHWLISTQTGTAPARCPGVRAAGPRRRGRSYLKAPCGWPRPWKRVYHHHRHARRRAATLSVK